MKISRVPLCGGQGDFKADPREIIRVHRQTLVTADTGRPRPLDWLAYTAAPIAVIVIVMCLVFHVKLSTGASAGPLTVSGLLGILLSGIVVQLSAAAIDLAASGPEPSSATTGRANFLEQLAANASYASLICILAAIIFVVVSIGSRWILRISSPIGGSLSRPGWCLS
jgi:hypothetical protein